MTFLRHPPRGRFTASGIIIAMQGFGSLKKEIADRPLLARSGRLALSCDKVAESTMQAESP